jgi:hypothetical protein
MRDFSQEGFWTITHDRPEGTRGGQWARSREPLRVESYNDLAARIASLQFHNPHLVLLFRGQRREYFSGRRDPTIPPTIFRGSDRHGVRDWNELVFRRFDNLKLAESLLIREWNNRFGGRPDFAESTRRLVRSPVIQWAILQHYDVCPTPLLDVTHSLRVALSFASLDNDSENAFLMVLGAPQISGAVSACAHNEMQVLRLSSLCPPSATRPHIQEGYLLGEYPELRTADQKMNLKLQETDFVRRLVAKFKFHPRDFWNDPYFPPLPTEALYPDTQDEVFELCRVIKQRLDPEPGLPL